MNYFAIIPYDILLHIIKIGRINYIDFLRFATSTKEILGRCLSHNQKIFRRQLLEDFEINVDLVDNLGRKIAKLPQEEQIEARLNRLDAYKLYCRLMRTYFKGGKGFRKDKATVFLIDARCPAKLYDKLNGDYQEERDDEGQGDEEDNDEYLTGDRAFSNSFGNIDDQDISLAILEYKYPDFRLLLRRGDIFEDVYDDGGRSSGISFWDGDNVIDRNYDYDDYGSVPAEFLVFGRDNNNLAEGDTDKAGFSPLYWHKPHNGTHELNLCSVFTDVKQSDFYWHCDDGPFCIDMNPIKKEVEAKRIFYYTAPESFGTISHYYFVKILFDGVEYRVMLECPSSKEKGCDQETFSDDDGQKYFNRLSEIADRQKHSVMAIYDTIGSDSSVYLSLPSELQKQVFE